MSLTPRLLERKKKSAATTFQWSYDSQHRPGTNLHFYHTGIVFTALLTDWTTFCSKLTYNDFFHTKLLQRFQALAYAYGIYDSRWTPPFRTNVRSFGFNVPLHSITDAMFSKANIQGLRSCNQQDIIDRCKPSGPTFRAIGVLFQNLDWPLRSVHSC